MSDKKTESSSTQGKKRSKNFYIQRNKRQKRNFVLTPGIKGYIVTCNNNKERNCIREAYDLLNEFADTLYGPESEENVEKGEKEDESIEDALKKEVDSLKDKERRFQVVENGVRNCLFIKTKLDDPCAVMYAILKDIEKTQTQRTKFLLRMLPVMDTCKAFIDDIKKCMDNLVTKVFAKIDEGYSSYALTFKIRNNNSLKRDDLLPALLELMQSKKLPIIADLKNPSVVINVEVVCKVCCLSIVKDYYKYRRCNLIELATKGVWTKDASVKVDVKDEKNDVKKEIEVKKEVESEENSNEGDKCGVWTQDKVDVKDEKNDVKKEIEVKNEVESE